MAYYSQVKMVCKAEDFDRFKEGYLEATGGDPFRLLDDCDEKSGCIVLSFSTKWNEAFREISAFYEVFDEAFSSCGKPASFVRVGEDWDDVETMSVNDAWSLPVHIAPDVTIEVW